MFNKGKATLIAVLCSIVIIIFTIVIEYFFPFEDVFHLNLPDYATRYIGWKLIWLIILVCVFYKNRIPGNDKETSKTLYTDAAVFVVVTEAGLPKLIYDIQKQKAQKEGLNTIEKETFLYVFSLLLYVIFIGCIITLGIFIGYQQANLEKLNRYVLETGKLVSEGQMKCASQYQPDFVSSCSVSATQSQIEFNMQFKESPKWMRGAQWSDGVHVYINGNNVRLILE